MKNFWLHRNKMVEIAHMIYGYGQEDLTLPLVLPVDDVMEFNGRLHVSCLDGSQSDRKLVWIDQDWIQLDGKTYRRDQGFLSVRKKRRGIFFYLVERREHGSVTETT